MIPDGKERVTITLDSDLVRQIDLIARQARKHRSTVLDAMVRDWLRDRHYPTQRQAAILVASAQAWKNAVCRP